VRVPRYAPKRLPSRRRQIIRVNNAIKVEDDDEYEND
jgi:hypothetical protein